MRAVKACNAFYYKIFHISRKAYRGNFPAGTNVFDGDIADVFLKPAVQSGDGYTIVLGKAGDVFNGNIMTALTQINAVSILYKNFGIPFPR